MSKSMEKIIEEFRDRFDHFNDAYIGHEKNFNSPIVGKQIDNWDCSESYDLDDVEKFLLESLSQQKAELVRKVEGMKKYDCDEEGCCPDLAAVKAYNQALSDVLDLIKEEK